eukprot:6212907-Pleurochrysis_carterae.AAC.2
MRAGSKGAAVRAGTWRWVTIHSRLGTWGGYTKCRSGALQGGAGRHQGDMQRRRALLKQVRNLALSAGVAVIPSSTPFGKQVATLSGITKVQVLELVAQRGQVGDVGFNFTDDVAQPLIEGAAERS